MTGRDVSMAAIYAALDRLERSGLVRPWQSSRAPSVAAARGVTSRSQPPAVPRPHRARDRDADVAGGHALRRGAPVTPPASPAASSPGSARPTYATLVDDLDGPFAPARRTSVPCEPMVVSPADGHRPLGAPDPAGPRADDPGRSPSPRDHAHDWQRRIRHPSPGPPVRHAGAPHQAGLRGDRGAPLALGIGANTAVFSVGTASAAAAALPRAGSTPLHRPSGPIGAVNLRSSTF